MTTDDIVIAEVDAPLTIQEQSTLLDCETTIERGLDTFVTVGEALAQIRVQRLYRATHTDWDSYIRERWPQIGSRRQADRFISAAEVVGDLSPIGLTVTNEAQARELAPLAPEQRRQAMQQAVAASPTGRPTAQDIRQAAATVRPPAQAPVVPAPTPVAAAPVSAPALTPIAPAQPAALPPALTPLTPAAPATPAADTQGLKLLYAKERLLAAALDAVRAELGAHPELSRWSVTLHQDRIRDAARVFLQNPSVGGAAAMLAFAATVEELPPEAPAGPRADLAGVIARLVATERWIEDNGPTATHDELRLQLPALAHVDGDLLALAEVLDDAAYNGIADRIADAQAAIRRRMQEAEA